eukprot:TRINITY_DN2354_c0_g2_i1.p1 TRINITY_DN2354_c0_g2~~TRINITY_DN2354_c0_g2_i1.p1  ORF type:complete len:689 (+),score=71.90 TRINITY_DN2354_c0_g2_i1:229-2067(+)
MAEVTADYVIKKPFEQAGPANGEFSWNQKRRHNQFVEQQAKSWAAWTLRVKRLPPFRILFAKDRFSHAWIIAEARTQAGIDGAWKELQEHLDSLWARTDLELDDLRLELHGSHKTSSAESQAQEYSAEEKPSSVAIPRSDSRSSLSDPLEAKEIFPSSAATTSSDAATLDPEVVAMVRKITAISNPEVLRAEKSKVQGQHKDLLEALINQRLLQVQFQAWESAPLDDLYKQRDTLLVTTDEMQKTFLLPFLEKILIARQKHTIKSMTVPRDVWNVRIHLLEEGDEWKIDQLMDTVNYHLWVVFRSYLNQELDVEWLKSLRQEIVTVNNHLSGKGSLDLETDAIRFVDERIAMLSPSMVDDAPTVSEPDVATVPPPAPPPLPAPGAKPAVRRAVASPKQKPKVSSSSAGGGFAISSSALTGVLGGLRPVPPRLKSDIWITKDVEEESDENRKISSTMQRLGDAYIDQECREAFGPSVTLSDVHFEGRLHCVIFFAAHDSNDVKGYALFYRDSNNTWHVAHLRVRSVLILQACLKELAEEIARCIQISTHGNELLVEFSYTLAKAFQDLDESVRRVLSESAFGPQITPSSAELLWKSVLHRTNMLQLDVMKRKL